MTKGRGQSHAGFAAFLDLRDSTFAWNNNADLAEQMLQRLKPIVAKTAKQWKGEVVNFTGDGFLVIYPQCAACIRSLAEIIEEWEPERRRLLKDFKSEGAEFPDEEGLLLRTGVAFGNYRKLARWRPVHYAGEVINRAQRCEAAGKPFFGVPPPKSLPDELKTFRRIFITEETYRYIGNKTDYHSSGPHPVDFKGYEAKAADGSGQAARPNIWVVWPKEGKAPSAIAEVDQQQLARVAEAASQAETAARLKEASDQFRIGTEIATIAEGELGKSARRLLQRAIGGYREALKTYQMDTHPAEFAKTMNALGNACCKLSNWLAGSERADRLQEAMEAYHEALKVYTFESSPSDYAMTQNNLGNALSDQAEMLTGDQRADRLREAVEAYRESLKVYTFESSPTQYAMTQNNLGTALSVQGRMLTGDQRADRLREAVEAYREALRVRTFESSPTQYAMTQNNLGTALSDQGRMLTGDQRADRLREAVEAYREALKVYTFESSPADYAMTQNNLGNALEHQAASLDDQEKAKRLKEAVNAYREALLVFDEKNFPRQHAETKKNLDSALAQVKKTNSSGSGT